MPRITLQTQWINAKEALKLLQWWDGDEDTVPDTRPLKKLADEKRVTRKKFRGNKYKYCLEDIEAVYLSQFN